MQHFDGHGSVELGVMAEIDRPETARTQSASYFVASESRRLGRGTVGRCRLSRCSHHRIRRDIHGPLGLDILGGPILADYGLRKLVTRQDVVRLLRDRTRLWCLRRHCANRLRTTQVSRNPVLTILLVPLNDYSLREPEAFLAMQVQVVRQA